MTTSSSIQPTRQPRPSSKNLGEPLPTLFRIPQIGASKIAAEAVEPVAAAPAESSGGQPPVEKPAAAAMSPEPRYERIDPSHSYSDLPELPPLDEPAGRSWMETVGSRLVLILLFLAVATVAIMATRDIPPASQSMLIADHDADSQDRDVTDRDVTDQTLHSREPVHIASAAPDVAQYPEPTYQNSSDNYDQDFESEKDLLVVETSDNKATAAESLSKMPAVIAPELPSFESDSVTAADEETSPQELSLPPMDEIEDGPSEAQMPAFPMPELALQPANNNSASLGQASSLSPKNSAQPPIAEPAETMDRPDAETFADEQSDAVGEESVATNSNFDSESKPAPQFNQPAYAETGTPNQITDWTKYVQNGRTVGFQQASSRQPLSEPAMAAGNNQFPYPTAPVGPSPLNRQAYPPYVNPGSQTPYPMNASAQQLPGGQQPVQQPAYQAQGQPMQYGAAAQQQQMPVYTPGNGYSGMSAAQQQLMFEQQRMQQLAWQQQQQAAQQQAAQQQQPVQQQPAYAPQPTGYGPPAGAGYPTTNSNFPNPNQTPYGGPQSYVPQR